MAAISTMNLASQFIKEVSQKFDDNPKPNDFDNFVPWACKELAIRADIIINRGVQKTYVSTTQGKSKGKLKRPSIVLLSASPDSADYMDNLLSLSDKDGSDGEDKIMIETYYDTNEHLVQLKFTMNKNIPRKIMQVVGLTIPYQRHLTSIKIDSGLNMESLYEISKFLAISQITELCFDYTFLSEANYHTVLSANKLKHLSLAKCKINDAVVKLISSQLSDPTPASRMLSVLNLSTNGITDDGAKYLADMLRSNRQLSYLNLAGNMITDEGGILIFNVLSKFPLQPQEVTDSRRKYVAYLRQKKKLYDAFIKDLQESRKLDKATAQKKKVGKFNEAEKVVSTYDAQILQDKAEYLTERTIGLFCDPFSLGNTVTENFVVHCLGNNTLCYLNIAYNSISYLGLQKLHEVLFMQKRLNRTPKGLIKVVIEGNPMPIACQELEDINILFGTGASRLDNLKKKSFVQSRTK